MRAHTYKRHIVPILMGSLFALFLFCGCTKVKKEYYPNGSIKSEISYKKGVMHGPAVWYYHNGARQMECTYDEGILNGPFTRWFFNGNPERIDSFANNMKNGITVIYAENGSRISEKHYVRDTLHGPFFEWHPNGQLMIEGRFYKTLYDGEWTYYDNKGLIVGKGIFEQGTGLLSGYYWNGRMKREINYSENQKHGPERWYSEDGSLTKEIIFDNGRIAEIVTGDTSQVNQKIDDEILF